MEELLAADIDSRNKELKEMPYDLLTDKDGLNLRPYQLNAIKAAEEAVINGKQTALLAMATGTGKTRTVLGMIYRFLKTERFRRILFLVDRTALGEQAQDVFEEVKMEDLLTLDDIYNIKGLEDKTIDKETRIHISTVQGMVKRIMYNTGETMPAVSDYDLLIIDDLGTECLNSMKLSELFTILNTRILNLNNKVTKTIISTNLNINNIFKNYEERIGSRIVGYYDIYYFFGEDLRFKRK